MFLLSSRSIFQTSNLSFLVLLVFASNLNAQTACEDFSFTTSIGTSRTLTIPCDGFISHNTPDDEVATTIKRNNIVHVTYVCNEVEPSSDLGAMGFPFTTARSCRQIPGGGENGFVCNPDNDSIVALQGDGDDQCRRLIGVKTPVKTGDELTLWRSVSANSRGAPFVYFTASGPAPACSDTRDNDADNLVDTADPGCSSRSDSTEVNETGPACDDGSDNDGDGLIDLAQDPGCTSVSDGELGTAACDNNQDDDRDGLIDFRLSATTRDPGCTSASDNSEKQANGPACDNDIDDDRDSQVDIDDPGCKTADGKANPSDTSEASQCQDGMDNDNDGAADADDPGCYESSTSGPRYNPNLDRESASSFDASPLKSPFYMSFNTFLGQSNFFEALVSGTQALNIQLTIYNRAGKQITSFREIVPASGQKDVSINDKLKRACARSNPLCLVGNDRDIDGDGLVNTYGLIRVDFDDNNPNARLLGRITNYRLDPGKQSHSFAFSREIRNANKNVASFAIANTVDPQGKGFLVANWAEIINLEKRQEFLYELFDISGNLIFAKTLKLNPREEQDVQAGHELRDSRGRAVQGLYIAKVTPKSDGAYLFMLTRYSANAKNIRDAKTFNFAFGMEGQTASSPRQVVFISNQASNAWREENLIEVANILDRPISITIIYRGTSGEVERISETIPAKSQKHFNASAVLAKHRQSAGTAVIVSREVSSLLVNSVVYYRNKSDGLVEAAYLSQSKTPLSSLLIGSTNTNFQMSNTVRFASLSSSNRRVSINFKGKKLDSNGTMQNIDETKTLTLSANSTQVVGLSQISSIREDSFGPISFRNVANAEIIAEVLRVRTQENGKKIDYVVPTMLK